MLLQRSEEGAPIHTVLGIPKGYDESAALVTVYKPDSNRWVKEYLIKAVIMTKRKKSKYIHEGQYVAEIDLELLESEDSWSPYLSIDDACKLDDARDVLKQGDLQLAAQYGQIYELRPVAHQRSR